jgi:hypothetical protein
LIRSQVLSLAEQTSTTLDRCAHSTSERDSRVLRSFAAFSLPPAHDDRS